MSFWCLLSSVNLVVVYDQDDDIFNIVFVVVLISGNVIMLRCM